MLARPRSLSPLADSRVNDSLLQIIPHFNTVLLQLVDVTYTVFIYLLLHESPDLVVDGVQIWAVWRLEIRTDEVRCLPVQQVDGVAGAMCRMCCWKHLLRQQDIVVIGILGVHLHHRVDKCQFSNCSINKMCNLRQI